MKSRSWLLTAVICTTFIASDAGAVQPDRGRNVIATSRGALESIFLALHGKNPELANGWSKVTCSNEIVEIFTVFGTSASEAVNEYGVSKCNFVSVGSRKIIYGRWDRLFLLKMRNTEITCQYFNSIYFMEIDSRNSNRLKINGFQLFFPEIINQNLDKILKNIKLACSQNKKYTDIELSN